MKKALPDNAKIAKDAKETVQECVSEFISFITSEACEKCKNEKRKTINGDDLLFALNTLGFENYVEILKLYLQKYRDSQEKNQQIGGITQGKIKKNKKKPQEENKSQKSAEVDVGGDASQIGNDEDEDQEQDQQEQEVPQEFEQQQQPEEQQQQK
eukprot:TRINITY_DN11124_c0_g2_i5.p3 TRINITY_DN11124_c0_g2~~TRINITY_DN11124_c0_g2_i5.p3  ORF type:complete len:155 (-),score=40.65 TRINITY_DN11124_c0_g2_i5:26-490(-)